MDSVQCTAVHYNADSTVSVLFDDGTEFSFTDIADMQSQADDHLASSARKDRLRWELIAYFRAKNPAMNLDETIEGKTASSDINDPDGSIEQIS